MAIRTNLLDSSHSWGSNSRRSNVIILYDGGSAYGMLESIGGH